MAKRLEKETLYLRHNYTPDERLKMGDDLAAAYNRQEDIDAEEAVVKSQFKERRASVEQSIGSLSRNLANQFEMRNVECRLEWDTPNPNEVSYVRVDNGQVAKVRPYTESERQQDLPLDVDQSQENIAEFFQAPLVNAVPEGVVVADGPPEKPEPIVPEPTEATKVAKAKKNLDKM